MEANQELKAAAARLRQARALRGSVCTTCQTAADRPSSYASCTGVRSGTASVVTSRRRQGRRQTELFSLTMIRRT